MNKAASAIRFSIAFCGAFCVLAGSVFAQYGAIGSIGASETSPSPASLTLPNGTTAVLDFSGTQPTALAWNTTGGALPGFGGTTATPAATGAVPVVPAPVTITTVGTPQGTSTIDPYAVPAKKTIFETIATEYDTYVPAAYRSMRRLCEVASLQYHLIGGGGSKGLEVNDLSGRLQFAIPCRFLPGGTGIDAPPEYFYIAPGVDFTWLKAPNRETKGLFGTYVDLGIQPRFNENFALDAWLRLGLYSDYEKVTSKSWRIQGRVMGRFTLAPRWEGTLGIMYLDRNHVKLLPSGGVIWTPTEDIVCRFVFPDPEITMRIRTSGPVEWWTYVMADYGGCCWTMTDIYDEGAAQETRRVDYNDIRLALGVRFDNPACIGGFAEIGGAFAREIVVAGRGTWKPENGVYFRVGLTY